MLSRISINNPVFALMAMASIVLIGALSLRDLGISRLPDVDAPFLTIRLTLDGASANVIEKDVVDIVEGAITGVEGVTEIRSDVSEGQASITVELSLETDPNIALQEIQARLARAMRMLPPDLEAPVITKTNPDDSPILWLTLTSDKPLRDQMLFVKNVLLDEFQKIPGVGEIYLGGYVDRNIRIWLDAKKMAHYELTSADVEETVADQHSELPGGIIEYPKQEYSVKTAGEAQSLGEFKKMYVSRRGGRPVYSLISLQEIARIEDGLDEIRRISRYNGTQTVGLGIRKISKSNAVDVARRVKQKLEELAPTLPDGYQLHVATDYTIFIEESIDELLFTLLLAVLLTGIVTHLFLGNLSASINVLIALPTSLIGTFAALYFFGFTLNAFTLLGLLLASGVLVDDAIMVLENIERHRASGKDLKAAALDGAQQITFAAFASTLSIMAIFLPVAFMKGITGRYFLEFGITVSFAVFLSLFEALTFTPMRLSRFQPRPSRLFTKLDISHVFETVISGYSRALRFALNRHGTVLAATLLVFVASLSLFFIVRTEFIPSEDQSRLMLRITTPPGSSLQYTDAHVKQIESYLSKNPAVDRYFCAIGGFSGGDSSSAMIIVNLKWPGERPLDSKTGRRMSQSEIAARFREEIGSFSKEMRIAVIDVSQRSFTGRRGYPVELTILGPRYETLLERSEAIQKRLSKSSLLVDVDSDIAPAKPELLIVPNRKQAALHGVSIKTISDSVQALIGGKRIGSFSEGGRNYDIRLRLEEAQTRDFDLIRKIPVRNNYGEIVPLGSVTEFKQTTAIQNIIRVNRERGVTLHANLAQGAGQDEAAKFALDVARELLPEGYRAVLSGTAKESKESQNTLVFALLIGILFSYMILASQFNSLLDPFIVLLALPFAVTGALGALAMSGNSLNVYSFIGILLLMGLVKKNSILLVDFTNRYRSEGLDIRSALERACPQRLRPILMTSLTSIVAALPPALSIGPGSEAHGTMAIVVVGGMVISTALTLFVIPAGYLFLHKKRNHPR